MFDLEEFEYEINGNNELLNYARSLPGAEKETPRNPIVKIQGRVIDGKLAQRAITYEENISKAWEENDWWNIRCYR